MVLAAGGIISAAGEEARFLSDINIQAFTANGTWTKPSGATWVLIEICAAGGTGGGAGATGASQGSMGDGGGGGEYARVWVPASSLTDTVAVTVGVGAAAVTTGAGLVGGTTSFGAYLTAIGGSSGAQRPVGTLNFSSAALQRVGGTGGAGTLTADLRIPGGAGGSGILIGTGSGAAIRAGDGGKSFWSGNAAAPDGNQVGTTGLAYGGGGSGAANAQSQSARNSGAGANGRVLITTLI